MKKAGTKVGAENIEPSAGLQAQNRRRVEAQDDRIAGQIDAARRSWEWRANANVENHPVAGRRTVGRIADDDTTVPLVRVAGAEPVEVCGTRTRCRDAHDGQHGQTLDSTGEHGISPKGAAKNANTGDRGDSYRPADMADVTSALRYADELRVCG